MQNIADTIRAVGALEVIEAMPNHEYHGTEHDSSSTLKLFAKSPKEYWHYRIKKDRESKKIGYSANIGTAVHAAVLEPSEFGSIVQVCSHGSASKAFREFADKLQPHQVAIEEKDLERIEIMANSLWDHEEAGRLLQQQGANELSLFWTEPVCGLPLKCRFDRVIDDGIIGTVLDIKCLADPSPAGFRRAVRQFRYDLSAALYCEGRNLAFGMPEDYLQGFYFLVVGNQWPHDTAVYRLGPKTMLEASVEMRAIVDEIAQLKGQPNFDKYPWPSETDRGVIEIEVLGYSGEATEQQEIES
jgi:hypothetical protein